MDSLDFETQLIGSMMIKGDHIDAQEIAGKLPAESFANMHLRHMYIAITSLLAKCEPVDPFSIQASVPESSKQHVLPVSVQVKSAANIKAWAKRVRQCWMLRLAKENYAKAIEILNTANAHNLNDCIMEASALTAGIKFESNDKLPRKIGEILPDYVEVFERRMKGSESGLYLKVGIPELDEKYGGFDRTDLIVVAGQPGMGKTEIAIMMANYIGSQRNSGLFVSMEMSDTQVAERHIADRSGLSVGRLRNPLDMNDEEYAKLTYAINSLSDQDNYILDDTLGVDEIVAHAEKLVRGDGLGFLCIDYLGLIKKNKAERNDLAIGDITRKLKQFSLKNKVPVILLSQLNRKVADRADKRPIIQDLRDSGSIEQDADVIIFPYREEVHDKNTQMKGIAEIIVAKYRSGEPGTFHMGWKNGHFVPADPEEIARKFAANEQKKDQPYSSKKRDWLND